MDGKGNNALFIFAAWKIHMEFVLLVSLCGLIIGLAKGGVIGPVAGALTLPLLSQIMTVTEAVGVTLPLFIIADVFALRFYWREWDINLIGLMMPMALVGIIIGTTLLTNLPDGLLRPIVGILTLLLIAYKLGSESLTGYSYAPRKWHGYLAGLGSGFGSALANIGGPLATAYLLLQGLNPKAFVGTVTLYFAIVNWTRVPFYFATKVIDIDILLSIAWMLPIIPFGVWLGRKGIERFDRKTFDKLMTFLLFITALSRVVRKPYLRGKSGSFSIIIVDDPAKNIAAANIALSI